MNRFLTCSQSQDNNNSTCPLIPPSTQAGFSVPDYHPFDVYWEEGTWLTYMGESLQAPLSHTAREVKEPSPGFWKSNIESNVYRLNVGALLMLKLDNDNDSNQDWRNPDFPPHKTAKLIRKENNPSPPPPWTPTQHINFVFYQLGRWA